ncbi:MAG: P-II family nitrogen regulator [Chloroflexi bacterium]|nr:P-II family nitrogen regulator [Chloroflexota bacterium]MDA1271529.1 P-II family nitrogen regulator [Chloroflexota bacterium]PKB58531.1 MAG: nitrogen fixation protein NifD [SAR202 cluster bacterium Casp-Chloro-G2]
MKMVRAIIRPDKEAEVASALAKANFPALTKWDVLGRGKQQGVQVGGQVYDELSKSMVLVVVEDDQVDSVRQTIEDAAFTSHPGDGKIFVTSVDSAHTIRTGQAGI